MASGIGLTSDRLGRIVEEAASEVYIFASDDFRFRLVNRGARENLGYTLDELRDLTPWDLKPYISHQDFLDLVEPLQSGAVERLDFETVHRRKDGTDYNVSVKLQVFDEGGDKVFYAAIQDITSYRKIESELREISARLDAILSNTTMSVFLMNEQQHCVFMNKAAETLTGFSFPEVTGRPLHDVIHHTHPDGTPFPLEDCPIDRSFPEQVGTQGEEIFVHKDGSFYPVAFTASPVQDDEAKVVGTIIEARDISEEKRNEMARNLLMREVDHRARNMLAVVHSLAQLTRADDLESYKAILAGRISALSRAQTSLANRRWEGGRLEDVVREELDALCPRDSVEAHGPEVALSPEQVQPISMLMHEMATNANKYGACSRANGKVSVTWTLEDRVVTLVWREAGGPPVVPPTREGFGSVLKEGVVGQIRGTISRTWDPAGLVVEVTFPL
jgi:PAS domain S-box-containing protein